MSATIWKAREEIVSDVHTLIHNNHPHLSYLVDEICVVFREKATMSGGQTVFGKVTKCSDLINAMSGTDYQLIMELAADTWTNDLDTHAQEALLDSLLCSIHVEENPKTGDMKIKILKPDIMAHRSNIEKYGMWMPKQEDLDLDNLEEVEEQG